MLQLRRPTILLPGLPHGQLKLDARSREVHAMFYFATMGRHVLNGTHFLNVYAKSFGLNGSVAKRPSGVLSSYVFEMIPQITCSVLAEDLQAECTADFCASAPIVRDQRECAHLCTAPKIFRIMAGPFVCEAFQILTWESTFSRHANFCVREGNSQKRSIPKQKNATSPLKTGIRAAWYAVPVHG